MPHKALVVCASIGFLLAAAICPARAAQYDYIAVTQGPAAARQGTVRAGGLMWQCAGDRCIISGPWAQPEVGACRELARAVGPLRSYGHSRALLSAAQMAQCNAEASAAGPAPRAPKTQEVAPMAAGVGAATPDKPKGPAGTSSGKGSGQLQLKPDVARALAASINDYVAETAGRARQQGRVPVGAGRYWACAGSRCNTPVNPPEPRASAGVTARMNTAMPTPSDRMLGCELKSISPNYSDVCAALARTVGKIKSFHGPGVSLSAQELETCNAPIVELISISARSGEDDLRRNSALYVEFVAMVGITRSNKKPVFTEIPKHVRKTEVISVDRQCAIRPQDFSRMKFSFQSGKRRRLDQPDNWDMVELTVRGRLRDVDGGVREVTLVDLRLNPIHRFRHNDEWEVSVPPGVFGH